MNSIRKLTFCLLSLSSTLILFWGCVSEEVALDTTPPAVVQITPRSADTSLVETGIDAVAGGHKIYLSWEPSLATDLAGYRIYRSMKSDEDLADTTLIVDLEPEVIWYEDSDGVLAPDEATGLSQGFSYWVTAYDQSGNESLFSEEACYKLISKPRLSIPSIQDDKIVLSWDHDQLNLVNYFVVRLCRIVASEWSPFWITTLKLFSPLEVTYPDLLESGEYLYKVDAVGTGPPDLPTGSENAYQFNIQ